MTDLDTIDIASGIGLLGLALALLGIVAGYLVLLPIGMALFAAAYLLGVRDAAKRDWGSRL